MEQGLCGLTGPRSRRSGSVSGRLICRALMPSSWHLWATSRGANGEDSLQSAFTFIPPVTGQMVSSFLEGPVTQTKVSVN